MSGREYDRRQVARLVASAAVLPLAALGAPLSNLSAAPQARSAPSGNFALERVLTRELGNGASIVVTRRWRIAFAPAESGLEVGGEQTFADVTAPPTLAPLAALEEARSTAGMFPLRLDRMGHIADRGHDMDADQLLRAIDAARALLERRTDIARDTRSFLAELANTGAEAVSLMPRDLFFPTPTRSAATREIALPGAGSGSISVSTEASIYPASGLLRASERVVVTRMNDSTRTSREAWALSPFG